MSSPEIVQIAAACHEANRSYCVLHGDTTQLPWVEAPEWQRESAIKGVEGVIAGNGPKESHDSWLAEKRATGWKYGPVKDAEKKEHPCFVPYEELPEMQKFKDHIFVSVASNMAKSLGLMYRHEANQRCKDICYVTAVDLAKTGYEAYAAHTGGKTFDGREMPAWPALPMRTVDAWCAASLAIIEHAACRRAPDQEE